MKLVQLPKKLEVDLGNGTSVFITHAGIGGNGLPRARVAIWNGTLLASDVIELDAATDRRRLAKAAAAADAGAVPDVNAVSTAIMQCAEALHAGGIPTAPQSEQVGGEPRPSADFPGLVDVVSDDNGEPAFMVLDSSGEYGVAIVSDCTPTTGPDADSPLVPPPARGLPWVLPRAAEVLRYLAPAADDDRQLYADVTDCIKRHALLPTLAESSHADAYYEMSAGWVFHTHYQEPAKYSPEIACYAVPERGKTRYGRTVTYMARRGVHTETLREANLFRDSQDRRVSLFLDCMNLWTKAVKLGCEDILLQRFERGAQVSRVLYPERGPFQDTVYYDIFGPTIIASNEPLGRILDTRSIPISMPLAPDGVEYPVPDETALLPLRERLTAWRARQLIAHWQPAPMPKPASSRLGDVLLPLMQIIAHVAPDRLDTFRALAKHLEGGRRQERALSWEAMLSTAVNSLSGHVTNGLLLISIINEQVNAERPEREQLTNKRISNVLRSLGLEVKKGHANKAALVWDEKKIKVLAEHYKEEGQDEPKNDAKKPASVGSGEANHANQVNPPRIANADEEDSVVSMVSVAGGHKGQESLGFFEHDADTAPVHQMCEDCGQPLAEGEKYQCEPCRVAWLAKETRR